MSYIVIQSLTCNYTVDAYNETNFVVDPTLPGYTLQCIIHRAGQAPGIVYMGWVGDKVFLKNIGGSRASANWLGWAIFQKNQTN